MAARKRCHERVERTRTRDDPWPAALGLEHSPCGPGDGPTHESRDEEQIEEERKCDRGAKRGLDVVARADEGRQGRTRGKGERECAERGEEGNGNEPSDVRFRALRSERVTGEQQGLADVP